MNNISIDKEFTDQYYYMDLHEAGAHDSMVIYGNYALVISVINNHKDVVGYLYDIDNKEYVTSFSMDYTDYDVPHANTACLGDVFYSEYSIMPVLYVSQYEYYSNRAVFVYDIVNDGGIIRSNLVQIIDPKGIDHSIIGDGSLDWVVDNDHSCLYALAYKLKGSSTIVENNEEIISKFQLPDIHEERVYLKDEDVIDSFTLDTFNYSQDKSYFDNCIYVISGSSDPIFSHMNRYRVIDLREKTLVINNSILDYGLREPEGLDFYNGNLMVSFNDNTPKMWRLNQYNCKNN